MYSAYCLLSGSEEPKSFEEAMETNEWKDAINKEFKSHDELGTWSEKSLPRNTSAIDTKWVFSTKEDGTKKARLVARGF